MSDARIRLEALPRYRMARELIHQRPWLPSVRRSAFALEQAAQNEVELEADLQRAKALAEGDLALKAFVEKFAKAKAELLAEMTAKLGEAPLSISDGVQRLLALVRTALPGPRRPGERTVAVVAAEKPNEAALGVVTVFGAPYLIALSADQPEAIPWVIGGAGLTLAGFVGRALTTAVVGGTCTVTNERVVWRPHRGEARQVELEKLKPDSVRMRTPRTVEFRAPDLLSMRMLESPAWAATAVAMQAWAGVLPPAPERVAFPASGSDFKKSQRGFGVVWRRGAAFFPSTGGKAAAAALLGHTPRYNVDLDALTTVLAQLPEGRFEQALKRSTEAAGGFLLEPSAKIWHSGPIEAVISDGARKLFAKLTNRNEEQLRHALQLFGEGAG